MTLADSAGQRLRAAVLAEQPLQMAGAINAYCAMLAEHAGFRALYLSGAGVANASYGLPDLGLTTLDMVLEDVRRIARATRLPLLVDADTGFGDAGMIRESVRQLTAAGAAGLHIEDQLEKKRCGHRPNKHLVTPAEMVARIEAAAGAREDPAFVIMARTDAVVAEGLEAALQRIKQYIAAGADMVFPEALSELDQYRRIIDEVDVPVLANITEFGRTPLFSREELAAAGVGIALYPLSAFRAMSAAAWETYTTLRREGSQQGLLARMQSRDELYRHLDYYRQERELDTELDDDNDDST